MEEQVCYDRRSSKNNTILNFGVGNIAESRRTTQKHDPITENKIVTKLIRLCRRMH